VTEFDKVIPPGGAGKVSASLDTSHYKGAIAKSITVLPLEPRGAPVVLQLKAEIVTELDVAPTETPLVRMTRGDPKPTELTVSASDGRPFTIVALQADPSVVVTVAPASGATPPPKKKRAAKAIAAGDSRYRVSLVPKADLPVGQTIANVTLTTDRPKAERVAIRTVIAVVGAVQVVPERLFFHGAGASLPVHARLTKRTGAPLKILGVDSSNADVTATTSPMSEGREYDLTFRYGGQPGRTLDARVTFRTDDPEQPAVVVPIFVRP
jgi:hypothetical protein